MSDETESKQESETPNHEAEKKHLELEKLRSEVELAHVEVGWRRKLFREISLLSPGFALVGAMVALIIGLAQIWSLQHKADEENLRTLLKDIGSNEEPTRLSGVSRLSTYRLSSSNFDNVFGWLVDTRSPEEVGDQIIGTVRHALWLETSLPVKVAMLDLLEVHYAERALKPLKKLRINLIRELKHENTEKESAYWNNHRDTLLRVALSIANINQEPPDFRCFPFKGIKLRQIVLRENADFTGSSLPYAEIWGGSLPGADFSNANLYGVTLKHVDLHGASFKGAELRNATLGPNLGGVIPDMFEDSNWRQANWNDAPELLRKFEADYGPDDGATLVSENREEFCANLLNGEFDVQ